MKLLDYKVDLNTKIARLNELSSYLKENYVGLDNVINEIITYMIPWVIFNKHATRPTIINLWGMTGTGKTSIVRSISDFLNVPLIQFDIGEYTGNDSRTFASDMFWKFWDMANDTCIILLDEIQNGFTIDNYGNSVDRDALRAIWSLLSDGRVVPPERNFTQSTITRYLRKIDEYNNNLSTPHKGARFYKKWFGLKKEYMGSELKPSTEGHDMSLADWDIDEFIKFTQTQISYEEIHERLDNNFVKTLEWMIDELNKVKTQPILYYKQALIFVVGNIDHIYTSTFDVDPDMSADDLHRQSKNITVPVVKDGLFRMFRAEQIARLGNNHIIYPAFSSQNYIDLIKLDLDRLCSIIREHFGVNIVYNNKVIDLLYRDGVYPTQGARPIFSTIDSIIASNIPKILLALLNKLDTGTTHAKNLDIELTVGDNKLISKYNGEIIFEKEVLLKIDQLRQPKVDLEHMRIAVHEAGHLIVYLNLFKKAPAKVSAYGTMAINHGFMSIESNDLFCSTCNDEIGKMAVDLGGKVAEEVVFGYGNNSMGLREDIQRLTMRATSLIRRLGYNAIPLLYTPYAGADSEYTLSLPDNNSEEVQRLCNDAYNRAIDIINNNKVPLARFSHELLHNSYLTKRTIEGICRELDIELNDISSGISVYNEFISSNIKKRNDEA